MNDPRFDCGAVWRRKPSSWNNRTLRREIRIDRKVNPQGDYFAVSAVKLNVERGTYGSSLTGRSSYLSLATLRKDYVFAGVWPAQSFED